MKELTKADVQWLKKLLDHTRWIHNAYPELFSKEDEETILITREILK